MVVVKNGKKWRGIVKVRGQYAGSRTFAYKRDAQRWVQEEVDRLRGAEDPSSFRRPFGDFLQAFHDRRKIEVRPTTYETEVHLAKRIPQEWLKQAVGTISKRQIERVLADMYADGTAYATVKRFRDVVRAVFTYLVKEGVIKDNPAHGLALPRRREQPVQMRPWSDIEWAETFVSWKERHQQAASVVLVLARTGLRWSEARALLVGDVELGEHPSVMVTKARPEGHTVSTTKSGKSRRVPLTADVAEVLRGFAEGKCPDDLLMPPMHRSRLTQQLAWAETSGERTLHDLRHTAICNWLRAGVDVATVREWAGHADLVMTSRYTHYLGLAHDALSIDKVNQLVSGINEAVGTSQVHTASNF